jgi:hypothetical protein
MAAKRKASSGGRKSSPLPDFAFEAPNTASIPFGVREEADPALEEVAAAGSAAVEASLVDDGAASGSAAVTHTVSDAGADAGTAVVEITAASAAA